MINISNKKIINVEKNSFEKFSDKKKQEELKLKKKSN